jgi:hypothetical protein
MASLGLNALTGKLDLKTSNLDKMPISDSDTYFKWVAPNTIELYVNGVKAQSWTI